MTIEAQTSAASDDENKLQLRLESIFMPGFSRQRLKAYHSGELAVPVRFVHYTSAEAALNVIKTKRVWMRNTTCMTDFREVQHGYDILHRFFSSGDRKAAFIGALDACAAGAAEEGIRIFDHWWTAIRFHTYIAAISEHDESEDMHGRLSMWRAFGGDSARVAIVFRLPFYSTGATALKLMLNPVLYASDAGAHAFVEEAIQNIITNCAFLQRVDRQKIVNWVFNMLLANATCLKHEGFREEREWRVIYCPKFNQSQLMKHSTEVVAGIPQTIYKIPFDGKGDPEDPALADIEFCKLFDRLIIGPSQYSFAIAEAFHAELLNAGVPDAGQHVFISQIPIRT